MRELFEDQIRAFELMVGPYAVAHQRVGARALTSGVTLSTRLPIYLMDTIAEPLAGTITSRLGLFGRQLVDERAAAEHVKSSDPILVVIGNPPWGRRKKEELGDTWLKGLLADAVALTPTEHRRDLKAFYDLFTAFWRWSLWLIGERPLSSFVGPSKGIISFITNRTWIVGPAFGGLRSLVRQNASHIYVIDLGGDLRGSPLPSGGADDPVFDIQTGSAIVFAVLDPNHLGPTVVKYKRLSGTRVAKNATLRSGFKSGGFRNVSGSDADPFLPAVWAEASDSPGIEEVFEQHETGVQTSRDSLVIATTQPELQSTLNGWKGLPTADRRARFHDTRERSSPANPQVLGSSSTRYAYRALDYRYLHNERAFVDWPRPELQDAFSIDNLALCTVARGIGAGPSAFPVNALPDLHVFRGHGGSRGIYPLLKGPSATHTLFGSSPYNLSAGVVAWLDQLVGPGRECDFFNYASALLGAPFYSLYFYSGLERDRVRIPLTLDPELFGLGARLGSEWVGLCTLRFSPSARIRWDSAARPTTSTFGAATWRADRIDFAGGRAIVGCAEEGWDYQVSGRPVLPKYLASREHWDSQSASLLREIRLVVTAADSMARMGNQLDDLLTSVLTGSLHRL